MIPFWILLYQSSQFLDPEHSHRNLKMSCFYLGHQYYIIGKFAIYTSQAHNIDKCVGYCTPYQEVETRVSESNIQN